MAAHAVTEGQEAGGNRCLNCCWRSISRCIGCLTDSLAECWECCTYIGRDSDSQCSEIAELSRDFGLEGGHSLEETSTYESGMPEDLMDRPEEGDIPLESVSNTPEQPARAGPQDVESPPAIPMVVVHHSAEL